MGTTHVGERVFLRDGGRGGRGNDQSLHRESKVGRRRRFVQDHSADQALSRLCSRAPSGGFSRNRDFQSPKDSTGFQPVVINRFRPLHPPSRGDILLEWLFTQNLVLFSPRC